MPQCTPSTTIRKKEKKRKKKKREERQTTTKTQMHVFCKPGTIQLCMTLSSPSLACSINLMTDYSYTNFKILNNCRKPKKYPESDIAESEGKEPIPLLQACSTAQLWGRCYARSFCYYS
jgi:hypothetical protein